jgi:vWA-MoxR associated protein C-terminal domain/Effector-associated domain 1
MGLTDDQIFDLNLGLSDALLDAFADEEALGLMVKRSLRTPLNNIKQNAQSYEATVDKVVEFAVAQGKVLPLVIGALKINSGNPKLLNFSRDNFQKLLQLGSNIPLDDRLLTSLIEILTRLTDFAEIVLPACARTLPDIETSHPDLRDQLSNNRLHPVTKWLILLDLVVINWHYDDRDQLYIILFVQNLELLATGLQKEALAQWLTNLPEKFRLTSVAPASGAEIDVVRPSDEALKQLKAYFVIAIEPLETSDADRYGVKGYIITRLGDEDSHPEIESVLLQISLPENSSELSHTEPYYTIEQIKTNFPDWLIQAAGMIDSRSREMKQKYHLDSLPVFDLTVEFWLPFEHLNENTETWAIYGQPIRLKRRTRVLGQDYRVVVRSFDRLIDPISLNKLNGVWQVLVDSAQNSMNTSLINVPHLDDWTLWESIRQTFSKICLGLSSTQPLCLKECQQQREELFSLILEEGIPLVLWSRRADLTNAEKIALKTRMQGMLTADILAQVGQLFENIKQSRNDPMDEQLALWCDEPQRLLELKEFRQLGRLRA